MRRLLVLFLIVAVCQRCVADESTAGASPEEEQIKEAIQGFFTATGNHDPLRMREVVDESLLIVEAGSKPDVHLFHSPNVNHLFPPQGNDDFKSLKIDRIIASVSRTNPTVAMASFRVNLPIDDRQRQHLQKMLDKANDSAPGSRPEVETELHGMEMFAMLVKKDGKWKIVALTVPK